MLTLTSPLSSAALPHCCPLEPGLPAPPAPAQQLSVLGGATDFAFSPHGDCLTLVTYYGAVCQLFPKTGDVLTVQQVGVDPRVQPLGVQNHYVVADADGRLRRSDVAPPAGEAPVAVHGDRVWGLAVSPAGRQALTAGLDETVLLWDLDRLAPLYCFRWFDESYSGALAFSPDGTRALVGWEAGVQLLDVEHRRIVGPVDPDLKGIHSVEFAPNGVQLFIGAADTRYSDGML